MNIDTENLKQQLNSCSRTQDHVTKESITKVQQMLVKVDEIQNRIKEDLKSEEKRNLERDKQKTDTIKRIGKEINKSVKKIINDIGFTVTNRDEGKGSTDNPFGRLSSA